jgi:hypothetical protein
VPSHDYSADVPTFQAGRFATPAEAVAARDADMAAMASQGCDVQPWTLTNQEVDTPTGRVCGATFYGFNYMTRQMQAGDIVRWAKVVDPGDEKYKYRILWVAYDCDRPRGQMQVLAECMGEGWHPALLPVSAFNVGDVVRCEAGDDVRAYRITAMNPEDGATEYRTYEATSLAEALTMAERDDAGKVTRIYGIQPEDYGQADVEGIRYNEADGLLTD